MSAPHEFGLPERHDEELSRATATLGDFVVTVGRLRETAPPVRADLVGPTRLRGGTMSHAQTEPAALPSDRQRSPSAGKTACLPLGMALLWTIKAFGGPAGVLPAAEDAPRRALLDQMAQGKVDTDLGRYDAAIAAFAAVAGAIDTTPALRTEALVRLGVARRETGDGKGAFEAFERASKDPGLDAETKALLVRGVGGVLPADDRWAEIWSQVTFVPDRSDPMRPTLEILWPGVPRTARVREGETMTLDFRDGDLQDIFRLFADFSGLNVVVYPGTQGKASLKVNKEPWGEVLRRILAPSGYAYALNDNVLVIGRPEDLPPPRRFAGKRIDVEWGPNADPAHPGQGFGLKEALEQIASAGEAHVEMAPGVMGRVVLKLNQVRWDQAFDLLARVNGLDWTRDGDTLKVFLRSRAGAR